MLDNVDFKRFLVSLSFDWFAEGGVISTAMEGSESSLQEMIFCTAEKPNFFTITKKTIKNAETTTTKLTMRGIKESEFDLLGVSSGSTVGAIVGTAVGAIVGTAVGAIVGTSVGAIVGTAVGAIVGFAVG